MTRDPDRQATVADLPGWPEGQCPAHVSQLVGRPVTWGRVSLTASSVVRDGDGRLWANGAEELTASYLNECPTGAWLYGVHGGIGLYLPPREYGKVGSLTALPPRYAERFVPITEVCRDPSAMMFAAAPPIVT